MGLQYYEALTISEDLLASLLTNYEHIPTLLKSTSPEGEVRLLEPLKKHPKDLDAVRVD